MKYKKPAICTGMCEPLKTHCYHCSHATWRGQGGGYKWEFEPLFGVTFLRGKYEWIPNERHIAWRAFDKWMKVLQGQEKKFKKGKRK